jgi:hypothetical protein
MRAILVTLIKRSESLGKGELAACLGDDCPSRQACALSCILRNHGVDIEAPPCPVTVELLHLLWAFVHKR